jgi:hypothetical protein
VRLLWAADFSLPQWINELIASTPAANYYCHPHGVHPPALRAFMRGNDEGPVENRASSA